MSSSQKPSMPIYYRLYFDPVYHLFFLSVILGIFGILYFWSHQEYEEDYKEAIRNAGEAHFRGYAITLNPEKGDYSLKIDGNELQLDSLQAPFEMEAFSSFKGTLTEFSSIAESINSQMDRHRVELKSVLQSVGTRFYRIPLAFLGENQASNLHFSIENTQVQRIENATGEHFYPVARAVLLSAKLFDENAANLVTEPMDADSNEFHVNNMIKCIASRYDGKIIEGPNMEVNKAVVAYFERLERERVAFIQDYIVGEKKDSDNGNEKYKSSNTVVSAVLALNNHYQKKFVELLQIELGTFWLVGDFRWLELIFWVWFGVLTKSIIDVGVALVGLRKAPFEPRYLFRTLAKLFYAPVLAFGIFFLASFIGADKESREFFRGSLTTLGLALLLGMFPNTAFRIIKDVATRVFREDLRTSSQKEPKEASTNKATTFRPTTEPYHLDKLTENVYEHMQAPLKHTPRS